MTVVQAVMLYRSETLVLTLCVERGVGVSHHRVAHNLTGIKTQIVSDGLWVYPLIEYAISEAVLHEVETYVSRH